MYSLSSPRALAVLLVAATALLLAAPARAGDRPYSSRGTAQFTGPTTFVGSGTATHLGRYREAGTVEFTPIDAGDVVGVVAHSTYTAANGDELRAVITGTLNTLSGAIVGTVTFTGGTGRFASASGGGDFTGQMLGGGALRAAINGSINY